MDAFLWCTCHGAQAADWLEFASKWRLFMLCHGGIFRALQ